MLEEEKKEIGQPKQYKVTDPKVFEEYCKDYHETERAYDWNRFDPQSSKDFYTGWARINNQKRWGFFINGVLSSPFGAAIIDEGKYPDREYVLDNGFLSNFVELAQKVVERYGEEIPTTFNVKNGLHRVALHDVDGYFITRNGNYDSVHGEPAFVSFDKKSKARSEVSWHKDGKKHRLNGPAFIRRNEREQYFIEGNSLSKEEWQKEVKSVSTMETTAPEDINDPKVWEAYCKNPDDSEVYFNQNYQSAVIVKGTDNADSYTGWAKGNYNNSLRAFFINGKISCPYGRALYWKDSKTSTEYYAYKGKEYKSILELLEATKETIPKVAFSDDVSTDFNGVLRVTYADCYAVYKDGNLNSVHDQPSFISREIKGRKLWHKNSKRHRETGPAVVQPGIDDTYYLNGKWFESKGDWEKALKEKEQPSASSSVQVNKEEPENPDRIQYKKVKDVRKFYGDKTFSGAVIDDEGIMAFFKEGKYHREDGPAFLNPNKKDHSIYEGWLLNGVQHNLNGPARVNCNGSSSHYINGNWFAKKDFAEAVKKYKEEHPEFTSIQERNEREASMESHKKVESYADFYGNETFTGSVIDKLGLVCYYKNGKKHREDGPAFINTRNNPDWVAQSYYCDGVRYGTLENDDWEQAVKKFQEEQKKLDEKWEEEEATTTVPSEKEEIAYRLAQKQLKSLVRHVLADEMGQGNKTKRTLAFDFLETELGSSLVVASMGVLLPKLEGKLPTKYQKHLGRLNREFRVAGLAAVGTEALELVTGSLGTKTRNILEATLPTTSTTSKTTTDNKQLETVLVTSQANNNVAR